MIGRSYGDRMQCWPSGINCQNFVLDKGTISQNFKIFFIRYSSFSHLYSIFSACIKPKDKLPDLFHTPDNNQQYAGCDKQTSKWHKGKAVMNQQVITAFILFIFPVGVFSS